MGKWGRERWRARRDGLVGEGGQPVPRYVNHDAAPRSRALTSQMRDPWSLCTDLITNKTSIVELYCCVIPEWMGVNARPAGWEAHSKKRFQFTS